MRDTIEMAREAGFHVGDQFVAGASEAELKAFADLVRADEREAEQAEHEADKVIIQYHEATIKRLEAAIKQALAAPVQKPSNAQIALLYPWMRPADAKELLTQILALGTTAQPAPTVQELRKENPYYPITHIGEGWQDGFDGKEPASRLEPYTRGYAEGKADASATKKGQP